MMVIFGMLLNLQKLELKNREGPDSPIGLQSDHFAEILEYLQEQIEDQKRKGFIVGLTLWIT